MISSYDPKYIFNADDRNVDRVFDDRDLPSLNAILINNFRALIFRRECFEKRINATFRARTIFPFLYRTWPYL